VRLAPAHFAPRGRVLILRFVASSRCITPHASHDARCLHRPPNRWVSKELSMRSTTDSHDLEARARRRVGRKLGFYIHALVYLLVNLGLYAIQAATGEPRWSHFPLMGWGLGLAIHGLVTFIALQGDGLRRGMLAREIDQLRRNEPR
jgi:2TM domain